MSRRGNTVRGRWVVVTGQVGSRHRSKRDARAVARHNRALRAELRRYHRRDWEWQDGQLLLRPRSSL